MLHLPAPGDATDTGVLLCPPLGRDNVFAHRSLYAMAGSIARGGAAVLHLDWPGCGDSVGDPAEAGIVDAWIDSVGAAANALHEHAGSAKMTVVGTKIGATLAIAAIARTGVPGDAVLWAPDLSGRAYLRELAAFSALSGAEGGGFPLGDGAEEALRQLDLLNMPFPDFGGRRILLIGKDDSPPDPRLTARLQAAGAAVTERRGAELGSILNSITNVPIATIDSVRAWSAPGEPRSVVPEPEHPSVMIIDGHDGRILEETAVVATSFGHIVVVTCRPERAAPSQPWVSFHSTAQIRRMGPSRMWTDFARAWAAQGVSSVRFDAHGVGDSSGPAAASPDLRTQYSSAVLETTREALAYTRARHGAERFALVGLCSGATTALELAFSDPAIASLALININLFSVADERLGDFRRVALRSSLRSTKRWSALLHGDIRARRVVATMRRTTGSVIPPRRRYSSAIGKGRAPAAALSAALDALESRGTPVLFVYSDPDEGLAFVNALPGGLSWLRRWPNVTVDVVPGAGHTFGTTSGRCRLRESLESHLGLAQSVFSNPRDHNKTPA